MHINAEVLYNAETRRYTLLDCDTGKTKQCTATTGNAIIDLFGKPVRKYFSNRKEVQKYMKSKRK